MQAIIMAAGKGSRLGSLTGDKPKAFLEVNNIKLIEYNIAQLHNAGVKDIVLVTGYKCEEYEKLTENIEGVRCVYNPFYELMNVLGSFFIAQHALKDEDTVYMHADTLCAPEIFRDMLATEGDLVLPIDYKECDEEAMKVTINDGHITRISKLIPCEEAAGEFIGIAKLSAKSIPAIKEAAKKLMKEKEFTSYFEGAIQEVIDQGGFKITPIATDKRFWGEVDFLEDYEYVCDNMPKELIDIAKKDLEQR